MPGFAAKSTSAGYVLGQALEDYPKIGSSDQTVLTFINRFYYIPTVAELIQEPGSLLQGISSELTTLDLADASVIEKLVVVDTAYVQGDLHVKGIVYAADLIANTITAKEKICVGQTCVTESQLKAVLELLDKQGSVAGATTPPTPTPPPTPPDSPADPPDEVAIP